MPQTKDLNTSIAHWIKNPLRRTSEQNHIYNNLNFCRARDKKKSGSVSEPGTLQYTMPRQTFLKHIVNEYAPLMDLENIQVAQCSETSLIFIFLIASEAK